MAARSELGISPVLLQAIAQTLTSSGSTSSLPSPREGSNTVSNCVGNNSHIESSGVNTNTVSVLTSHTGSHSSQESFDSNDNFSSRFGFKQNMDNGSGNEPHSSGRGVSHLLQNLNEPVGPLMSTQTGATATTSSYQQQDDAGLSMLGIAATSSGQVNTGSSAGSEFDGLGFSGNQRVSSMSTPQHFQQEAGRPLSDNEMSNFLLKQEIADQRFATDAVAQQQENSADPAQNMNSVSNVLSALASHAQKSSSASEKQEINQEKSQQQAKNTNVTLVGSASSGNVNTTTGNTGSKPPIIIYSYVNSEGQEVTVPVSTATQIIVNNDGTLNSAVKNPGTAGNPATYRVVLQSQGTSASVAGLKQLQSGSVTLGVNSSQAASGTTSSGLASGSASLRMVMPVTDAQNTQDGMNQPCPVCGDKVSGYHYGIFTCESCKGFFKRTVQNKKTFVCPKSSDCTINSQNRKKCPACRFKRCLEMGMKLEAIRQDRTRGGRSSYDGCQTHFKPRVSPLEKKIKRVTGCLPGEEEQEPAPAQEDDGSASHSNLVAILNHNTHKQSSPSAGVPQIPELLRDIMNLEPLLSDDDLPADTITESPFPEQAVYSYMMQLAELRLYKLVRWARNLPQFGAISTDDQILLLQNCWSELMALSLCWRSIDTPNQISISSSHHITAAWAHHLGFEDVVIQLINITDCFRRLFMDQFEYVALKVLLLITPDVKGLKEPRKIRDFQDKILEALLAYTTSHYKNMRHKFGELLLRLPELSRISFMSKDILIKSLPSSMASCGLLVELLKGDNKGEGDSSGGLRF